MAGLAAIFPSREVEAALDASAQRAREFEIARAMYEYDERNPRAAQPGPSTRLAVDQARDQAIAAISNVERVMREELATL